MDDVLEYVKQQNEEGQPDTPHLPPPEAIMQKFRLYETRLNFYMVGRDKSRRYWKVLKIDRLKPSELSICEDPTAYTERECSDLLRRIHEGNKATGGLKFVTTCCGIVGGKLVQSVVTMCMPSPNVRLSPFQIPQLDPKWLPIKMRTDT